MLTNRNFTNNSYVRAQNSLWKATSYALITGYYVEAKHKKKFIYSKTNKHERDLFQKTFYMKMAHRSNSGRGSLPLRIV